MIPPEFIDELLARVDIVEVIEPRVALKKAGKDYTGLCPFHNEKSPSFSVSQDKQFYYCFGCQATGSALKFLMEFDRMDFLSAVEHLAGRVGMEVPKEENPAVSVLHQQRKKIYDVLESAATFYREQLRHSESRQVAVDYLKRRGMTGEIARDFGLGYAPPGWDNLLKVQGEGDSERRLLIEAGMVIDNPEEKKTYDRFRDRIMFPIRDLRGRTIAFGGRIIGEGKPKYLNSPETPVFQKGRELYGLYEARIRTAKLKELLVVEGYMDVVALAQHDISYAVATLGTATTADHIDRLYRLVPRIVFGFDGDSAGRNAAWKALQAVLPYLQDGRSAAFLFLPDGEDPDSLVRSEGREGFELRLSQAMSTTDFLFDHLADSLDPESPEGKAALSKQAVPLIHRIPEGVFRQLMINELSKLTGLETDRLLSAIAQYREEQGPASSRGETTIRKPADTPASEDVFPDVVMVVDEQMERAVSMLLGQPELALEIKREDYRQLENDHHCSLLIQLVDLIYETDVTDPNVIMASFLGQPEFERLRALANRDQLLSVDQYASEYRGILGTRIAAQSRHDRASVLKEVLNKPIGDLTETERALVREYYEQK